MHNCKSTRNSLTELAFDELPPTQKIHLLAHLDECPSCREEYAAVRNALRVVDQKLRSALPSENFWSGYHSRLRRRIDNVSSSDYETRVRTTPASLWVMLQKLATATVRVPVPVAAVVVLLFTFATLFAMHARRGTNAQVATGSPATITRTIEVPVTQEKILTKVVYVDRERRRFRSSPAQKENDTAVATSGTARRDAPTVSLVGFKPAEQVKLTIIKGSYKDEK
jgi:anti-sigma factor RsiW